MLNILLSRYGLASALVLVASSLFAETSPSQDLPIEVTFETAPSEVLGGLESTVAKGQFLVKTGASLNYSGSGARIYAESRSRVSISGTGCVIYAGSDSEIVISGNRNTIFAAPRSQVRIKKGADNLAVACSALKYLAVAIPASASLPAPEIVPSSTAKASVKAAPAAVALPKPRSDAQSPGSSLAPMPLVGAQPPEGLFADVLKVIPPNDPEVANVPILPLQTNPTNNITGNWKISKLSVTQSKGVPLDLSAAGIFQFQNDGTGIAKFEVSAGFSTLSRNFRFHWAATDSVLNINAGANTGSEWMRTTNKVEAQEATISVGNGRALKLRLDRILPPSP